MNLNLMNFYSLKQKNNIEKKHANPVNTAALVKFKSTRPLDDHIAPNMIKKLTEYAASLKMTPEEFIMNLTKPPYHVEPSVTVNVGRTKVTTVIDGEQIFNRTVTDLMNAKDYIVFNMFELQYKENGQQRILEILKEKKEQGVKIMGILDAHKWDICEDEQIDKNAKINQDEQIDEDAQNDKNAKHYNNINMIRTCIENGFDILPAPTCHMNGGLLNHIKFYAVDGKKTMISGMNWGTHSPVNHDFGVAIETRNGFKKSEVDNMIDEFFIKPWYFALYQLKKIPIINGPLNKEEREKYNNLNREIKPENLEFVKILGKIVNNDYIKDMTNLELPKVKPLPANDCEIKVLTTRPRQFIASDKNGNVIDKGGSESIGDYIKSKLDDDKVKSFHAELFVLSHKEIVQKIIKRYKDAKAKGETFEAKILISPDLVGEFPYCRKPSHDLQVTLRKQLKDAEVPFRLFKVKTDINQRLHAKLYIFNKEEVLLGSPNCSAAGLETNLAKGVRPDYKLINKAIDDKITKLEEELEKLKNEHAKTQNKDKKIELLHKVHEIKDEIKDNNDSRPKYKRGNCENAIVIKNKEIAEVFLKQIESDFEYSKPEKPDGYGGAYKSFKGKKELNFTATKSVFNKIV